MFERFTERARQVVVLAEHEAGQLSMDEVGSDHLLLALIAEQEGLAARVLDELSVTYDQVRALVARRVDPAPSRPSISSEAKKALEMSLREALSLGHNYIGTEHILLGLMRAAGSGSKLLEQLGVSPDSVRTEIIDQLSGPGRRQPVQGRAGSERVRTHRSPALRKVDVPVKPVSPAAQVPAPAYAGDGASDLVASEEVLVVAGGRALVATGLTMAIPLGYAGLVLPRSGLAAKHGVTVLNTPGLIDSGYRGEVKVILFNTGSEPFHVEVGDRIAQLMIVPLLATTYQQVDELPESERGDGGFGSSGIKTS